MTAARRIAPHILEAIITMAGAGIEPEEILRGLRQAEAGTLTGQVPTLTQIENIVTEQTRAREGPIKRSRLSEEHRSEINRYERGRKQYASTEGQYPASAPVIRLTRHTSSRSTE
jgi:hypothetical protein